MINDLPDDFELDDQPRLARQDVPWARRNQDGAKWGPYFLNKGSYADRLVTDEQIIKSGCDTLGVEERAFAMMWDYHLNGNDDAVLGNILGQEIISRVKDDRDEILIQLTAQAVIQWLGTICGRCFVDEARRYAKQDMERLCSIREQEAAVTADLRRKKEEQHRIQKDIQEGIQKGVAKELLRREQEATAALEAAYSRFGALGNRSLE
jgi:hypothetical protein